MSRYGVESMTAEWEPGSEGKGWLLPCGDGNGVLVRTFKAVQGSGGPPYNADLLLSEGVRFEDVAAFFYIDPGGRVHSSMPESVDGRGVAALASELDARLRDPARDWNFTESTGERQPGRITISLDAEERDFLMGVLISRPPRGTSAGEIVGNDQILELPSADFGRLWHSIDEKLRGA